MKQRRARPPPRVPISSDRLSTRERRARSVRLGAKGETETRLLLITVDGSLWLGSGRSAGFFVYVRRGFDFASGRPRRLNNAKRISDHRPPFRTRQVGAGVCALDGAALRRLVEREFPQLVLLDVGIPGEDGFALAVREKWPRRHHQTRATSSTAPEPRRYLRSQLGDKQMPAAEDVVAVAPRLSLIRRLDALYSVRFPD